MQNSRLVSQRRMRGAYVVLFLAAAAGVRPAAAEDTPARVGTAIAVLTELTDSSQHGMPPEKIIGADCIAIVPGFKKGAAIVGASFGRGFISCRVGDNWSAP